MFLIKQTKKSGNDLICYIPAGRSILEKIQKQLNSYHIKKDIIKIEWNAGVFQYNPVILFTIMTQSEEVDFAFPSSMWGQLTDIYEYMELRWGDEENNIEHSIKLKWHPDKFSRFLEDCFDTYINQHPDHLKQTVLKQIVYSFFKIDPDDAIYRNHMEESNYFLH